MGEKEVYMLQRDQEETNRLNEQSKFLRALFNDQLLHPSIPRDELHEIADIGTGTGIWMDEAQQELDPTLNGQNAKFVGVDISDAQFPRLKRTGQEFLVHDAVEPFPTQYRDRFDLVHVRFLSYGIKAHQLENFVNSLIQILRPGGWLQWEEVDAIDARTVPAKPKDQQVIACLVSERLARGLTPAITTPLIRTLQTRSLTMEPDIINPMCWTRDLLRIYHLDSFSTYQHPSPQVKLFKNQWNTTVVKQLLQSGVSRISALAKEPGLPSSEVEQLEKEASKFSEAIQTVKRDWDSGVSESEVTTTRIVARQAMLFGKEDIWMSKWHRVTAD